MTTRRAFPDASVGLTGQHVQLVPLSPAHVEGPAACCSGWRAVESLVHLGA
ncbi:hypothetical protein [Acetobacter malorum]|uniref:hypothetical protein n=1 Tax=Acetobacter malorum TaxID=178901 RepID=UPI001E36A8A1|nr:hypothetical protein [Acetobacter malorum]